MLKCWKSSNGVIQGVCLTTRLSRVHFQGCWIYDHTDVLVVLICRHNMGLSAFMSPLNGQEYIGLMFFCLLAWTCFRTEVDWIAMTYKFCAETYRSHVIAFLRRNYVFITPRYDFKTFLWLEDIVMCLEQPISTPLRHNYVFRATHILNLTHNYVFITTYNYNFKTLICF